MKHIKFFLISFVLLAIASAFVIKSHVQPTANKTNVVRPSMTVCRELVWTGAPDFVITDESSTTRLTNTGNWSALLQVCGGTPSCSGSGKVCKIIISYTYNTPPGDPMPTVQQIINALAAAYVPDINPPTHSGYFVTPITFTVPGNSTVITVTIVEKS